MFLTFLTPNFVPNFEKSLERFLRLCVTDGRTDRTDFIGLSRFSTGDQKINNFGQKSAFVYLSFAPDVSDPLLS